MVKTVTTQPGQNQNPQDEFDKKNSRSDKATAPNSLLPGIEDQTLDSTSNNDLHSRSKSDNEVSDNDEEKSVSALAMITLGSKKMLLASVEDVSKAIPDLNSFKLPVSKKTSTQIDNENKNEKNNTDTPSCNNKVDKLDVSGNSDIDHGSRNEYAGLSAVQIQKNLRK